MVLILSTSASNNLALQESETRAETDRAWYLAGEPMIVNVSTDNGLIAYAELCDTYGLKASAMIILKGGNGKGVIELPPNLHSGYYALSVYTRSSTDVFHQLVAVVNPLHRSKDDDIEWVKITHPDSLSYTSAQAPLVYEARTQPDVRETEGHIIKARIKNIYDGHTFRASQIRPSISIIGKQIHYFEGKMVNDSTAFFYTYGIHGKQPLVLSAFTSTKATGNGVSLPIEIISPFATLLPQRLPNLVFHYQRSEVEARSIDMQRHQKAIVPVMPLDYDDHLFGIKPDLTYNLDEYRQFHTIEEVLIEYVNCASAKKIDGIPQLFVRKEQDQFNTSLPTLVLIDGMPVFDTERLLKYDARRIHYINIYSDQYTFGNVVYNGILSFVTRSGQLTNYPIERNMQYLEYDFPE